MAMPDIPMYVFTGFLESGKTKFIQETLEDERFNTGERTLLLVFEEGEEEYDVSTYPHKEVYEQVLDYDELSPEMLTGLQKKYNAERVVVELNGMHLASDFYLQDARALEDRAGGHVCRRDDLPQLQRQHAPARRGQAGRGGDAGPQPHGAGRGRHALPQDRPGRQPPDRYPLRLHRRLDPL